MKNSMSLEESISLTSKINHAVFPTLITEYNNFLTPEQCDVVFNQLVNKEAKDHQSLFGDAKSTHNNFSFRALDYIYTIDGLSFLEKKFNLALKEYTDNFGLGTVCCCDSWFNIQNQGSMLNRHVHPGSVVSGALYIKADENSSHIVFDNPNQITSYYLSCSKITDFNMETYSIKPKTGSLLIFPSWLFHGSGKIPNGTKNRLVVSFNTTYKNQ